MDALLRARILACPNLPTLPAVALEVLELCRHDDEDLDAIARAVQRDPAISAKLLRLANSASLATRGKVSTLGRAIAIVGTNATVTTALSFSLLRERRRGEGGSFDHGAFWRRSLFCAIAGRALAESLGLEPEETFLACLLQDIGQLVLAEVFPADYGQVWLSAGGHRSLEALEREALGVDHLEAGLLLAERWNLPELLREAIAGSHVPSAPKQSPTAHSLGRAVFLSGPLADVWIGPGSPGRLEEAVEAAEDLFGPVANLVRAALARMALAVPEASSDFDLDLGGPAMVEAVLAEARTARRARGAPDVVLPGAAVMPESERAAREALDFARARGHGLAALLVRPRHGARGDVLALVGASLRGTDVVSPRGRSVLALLFDPAPGGVAVVVGRMQRRAVEAGIPLSIGVAEWRGPDGSFTAEALVAEAEADLRRAEEGGEGRPC